MNIQAQKIELIKLITEIDSEPILKKIRKMLASPSAAMGESYTPGPAMEKRLLESKKQIADGKGVKVNLDDIWK